MKRPSLGEVKAYWAGVESSGGSLMGNPEEFYDHFESNGWKVGRSPMADWHAAARNWSRNEAKFGHSGHVTNRPGASAPADTVDIFEGEPGSPERAAHLERMRSKP